MFNLCHTRSAGTLSPFLVLCLLIFILGVISLKVGTVEVPWSALWDVEHASHAIIWQIRWPRILNAIFVGCTLSLSGLMVQNMVKNPLADPYLLGVSGGAATGQLILILTTVSVSSFSQVMIGFGSSLGAALLLLKLSYFGQIRTAKLTLNGIVMAFGFAAVISFILSVSPPDKVKSMMFWLMGDLSFGQAQVWQFVLLFLVVIILYRQHRSLDLLARGEWFAIKSGVDAKRLNLLVFTAAALLTSMAVAQAGTIGFVGLVVPHLVRMLIGNSHRVLIPLCSLAGAVFLLLADTLSRILMPPLQLPVGIFTALVGVPVFMILNRRIP